MKCFKYGNSLPQNDSVPLDNIKRYQGLETANFDIVALNNMGEAVYDPYHPPPIIVNDYALIELAPGYVEAEAKGDGLAEDFDLFGSGSEPFNSPY